MRNSKYNNHLTSESMHYHSASFFAPALTQNHNNMTYNIKNHKKHIFTSQIIWKAKTHECSSHQEVFNIWPSLVISVFVLQQWHRIKIMWRGMSFCLLNVKLFTMLCYLRTAIMLNHDNMAFWKTPTQDLTINNFKRKQNYLHVSLVNRKVSMRSR